MSGSRLVIISLILVGVWLTSFVIINWAGAIYWIMPSLEQDKYKTTTCTITSCEADVMLKQFKVTLGYRLDDYPDYPNKYYSQTLEYNWCSEDMVGESIACYYNYVDPGNYDIREPGASASTVHAVSAIGAIITIVVVDIVLICILSCYFYYLYDRSGIRKWCGRCHCPVII